MKTVKAIRIFARMPGRDGLVEVLEDMKPLLEHISHLMNIAPAGYGLTLKLTALDVPPVQSIFAKDVDVEVVLLVNVTDCDCGGLKTVTFAAAREERSAAVIVAFSGLPLTKVVARAVPFHSTVESRGKWSPLTMSLREGLPAVALAGVIEASDGVSTQSPQDEQPKVSAIIKLNE